MMDDRTTHLLRALAAVPVEGTLDPVWDANSRTGFAYRGTGSALEDDRLGEDLEYLAGRDYLDRVFVERVSLCGNCESHALNVHEACMSCGSSNLAQFKALLHFRCGYVGPVSAFREERSGLRCPKCNRILQDLGTDHDSPGEYFRCRACTAMFQVPEVGARCLSCGARFTAGTMQQTGHRDVFAYRLTSLGKAALAEKRLLEDAPGAQSSLRRRHLILEDIETARRGRVESGARFGVVVVRVGSNGAVVPQEDVAASLRRSVAREVKLGRLDSQHLVVLIPDASESVAKAVRGQIAGLSGAGIMGAEVVEIADNEAVPDALDVAARQLDAHG